jgi:hypothetical protein
MLIYLILVMRLSYMTDLKQILKYKHIIAISIAAIAIASYVVPITQIFPFARASSVHQTSAQSCITGAYGGSCQNLNSQNAGNDIVSNVIGIQSPSTRTLFDSIAPTSQPVTEGTQGATPSTSQPSSTNEADGGHSTDPTSEKDTNTNTNTNTNSGEKDTSSSGSSSNSGEKDTSSSGSSSNSGEKDTSSSGSSSSNSGEKDTSSSGSSSNSGEKDTKNNRSQGEKDT